MGLDSVVKKTLREQTKSAFSYYRSLGELYDKCPLEAVVVDVNVELFKKPQHVKTGMEWARWVFDNRVKKPPVKFVVLLFDSAPRVPLTKDLTHLQRSGDKRKRGFVPLPPDTLFGDNIDLPDWSRVTGSKHLLPRVWDYLIGAIRRLTVAERFDRKTVFFDKPLSLKLAGSRPSLDGAIEMAWKAGALAKAPPVPKHLYGEGDMKTRAWVVHLMEALRLETILVLSTDLDNIPIFCEPRFRGVHMLGNPVGVANGKVVTKKQATTTMHEAIDLGKVAALIGERHYPAFRAILCMGKTDFNWNVHKMTTERMLKTFFWSVRHNKTINATTLLESTKGYGTFYQMCHSKICGHRRANAKLAAAVTREDIKNYLLRCQWVHRYWTGDLQALGGPDPSTCPGYKKPGASAKDLKEYGGKVRLVPA